VDDRVGYLEVKAVLGSVIGDQYPSASTPGLHGRIGRLRSGPVGVPANAKFRVLALQRLREPGRERARAAEDDDVLVRFDDRLKLPSQLG
jgi:hypothetical protein